MSPSSAFITAEIERSLEPCAIARMFTSRLASESKKVPATPLFYFMPSPIIETMAQSAWTFIGFISFVEISSENSDLRTS